MVGLLFDDIEKPHLNLAKVGVMLAVNVTGDVLAYRLTDSATAVAVLTTITLAAGIAAGRLLPSSGATFTAGGPVQPFFTGQGTPTASSTRDDGSSKSIQNIDV
jgi:hypothetical protein